MQVSIGRSEDHKCLIIVKLKSDLGTFRIGIQAIMVQCWIYNMFNFLSYRAILTKGRVFYASSVLMQKRVHNKAQKEPPASNGSYL